MNTDFATTGQRVRARVRVTEDGTGNGDPSIDRAELRRRSEEQGCATIPGPYVHAEPGEEGIVVHDEPGYCPTVRFDRTGTATCVREDEVEVLPPNDHSDQNRYAGAL